MAWVLRLVEIGAEGEGRCADVVEISRPDGLVDIADLGLTLAEAKLVLAGIQREIVAAQARDHAVRRPECRRCGAVCRVKDYRQHAIATLFGQVTVRLPRFRCAGCGRPRQAMIGHRTAARRRRWGSEVLCPIIPAKERRNLLD